MQAAKRRRVDVHLRGSPVSPGNASYGYQQGQTSQQYLDTLSTYAADHVDGPAHPSNVPLNPYGTSTPDPASTSTTSQQWFEQPYAEACPEASTYAAQQHFFAGYNQTDPSTYNSPWPPQSQITMQGQSQAYGDQVTTHDAPSVRTMPFFTSADGAATARLIAGSNSAPPLQHHSVDVDIGGAYSHDPSVGAVQGTGALPAESPAMAVDDASMQLKRQSLPILDNLATQLINKTAKVNLPQIQEILTGSDTEEGQAYNTLKSLFEQTRKVYSRETAFIDAIAIQMFQPSQQEIIRKANIATFISSILGAHDVSFFDLNEYFMETFVPLGHRLLKWQGAIFLELKTQAYISALINSDGSPGAMLDELFPSDLDAQILTRHPDAPSLSPSEHDFMDRCRARKSYLLAEGNVETALRELPRKYQWSEFVRELAGFVSKNVDAIVNGPVRTQHAPTERKNHLARSEYRPSLPTSNTAGGVSGGHNDVEVAPKRPPLPTATSVPPPTVRQPWSKPEEEALLSGLARVDGPHWSQILALYGRGGSVSEVLKDRNQVQLKDKARNLKLWHLKTGREVPVALQGVTGELRKRGGKFARAASGLEGEEMNADGEEAEALPDDAAVTKGNGSIKRKTKKGS